MFVAFVYPIAAVSVHLVCGVWETLAVGIFSTNPANTSETLSIRACR